MNDEQIASVQSILNEWNPLGDMAATVKDLEGYHYEAIDILSTMAVSGYSVQNAVSTILEQAFNIMLDESKLKHYSSKIEVALKLQL